MEIVSKDYIRMLVNKYSSKIPFEDDEKDRFYCKNDDGTFTACFNSNGYCYVEDFAFLESVVEYLEGELETEEIHIRDMSRTTCYLPIKLEEED